MAPGGTPRHVVGFFMPQHYPTGDYLVVDNRGTAWHVYGSGVDPRDQTSALSGVLNQNGTIEVKP